MFHSLKKAARKKWFDINARGIRQTPQVACDPNSRLIVLSQLHHPDVIMYLVAAKSLARYITPLKFVIVDDGLTPKDRELLKQHFQQIEFIGTRQVETGPCPTGGTWERILSIASLNKDYYIIQMDADTITINSPSEVINCISKQTCFAMGTPGGESIVTLEEIADQAKRWTQDHVQVISEVNMHKLPPEFGRLYVHGCSGFAGFAPNSITTDNIYKFSKAMENIVGKSKWKEWGSEQVTSNYFIANHTDAYILPIDAYPFWRKDRDISKARVIHFFGTHRFEAGQYVQSARKTIQVIGKQSLAS
jgi:hypothetical protein